MRAVPAERASTHFTEKSPYTMASAAAPKDNQSAVLGFIYFLPKAGPPAHDTARVARLTGSTPWNPHPAA
jgi:hypothetical protein